VESVRAEEEGRRDKKELAKEKARKKEERDEIYSVESVRAEEEGKREKKKKK